jgi:hypothetical protein
MDRIRKLFLLLALVGPLHMLEQLAFGVGEIARIRVGLGGYYILFANADRATVILVTIVGASVPFLAYGLLAGGVPRLISTAVFALLSVFESHHMVETFLRASYDPGVVTAVPFGALGVMLLVAIRAEYRRRRITWADVAPAYQAW